MFGVASHLQVNEVLTAWKNRMSRRMFGILRKLIWQGMLYTLVNKWQIQNSGKK